MSDPWRMRARHLALTMARVDHLYVLRRAGDGVFYAPLLFGRRSDGSFILEPGAPVYEQFAAAMKEEKP